MIDLRQQELVELAPLTRELAIHIARHLMQAVPRQSGRPRREEIDINIRIEARLFEATNRLIELVREKRQTVYDLVYPAFLASNLTQKWLMQTLNDYMPDDKIIYPQRLREWRQSGLLLMAKEDIFEPQSVSRILLARMIDTRKSGWLQQPAAVDSYWYWRQDGSNLPLFPYKPPLVLLDDTTDTNTPIYKSRPEPGPELYILSSPWKGAAWNDPAWVVFDSEAARWVGEPTGEQLDKWISPEERASLLPSSDDEGNAESPATQILRLIVAKRFLHGSPFNGSTPAQ